MNDALARCVEAGTPEDWERFLRKAQPVVASSVTRTLARWSSPTPEQVDNLVRETLLRLHDDGWDELRHFGSESPECLPAYLRTLASSAASDLLRSLGDQNPAAEQAGRAGLLGQIERCLSTEQDRDRWLFWLYYRHGLTPQAISGIASLKLTATNVETAIDLLAQVTAAEEHLDMLRAEGPGAVEPSCLALEEVARLAGQPEVPGTAELFDHIVDCDRCGGLLWAAVQAADESVVRGLRTASPEWQAEVAKHWGRESRAGWLSAAASFARRLKHPGPAPARRPVVSVRSAAADSEEPPTDPPA